MSTDTHYGVVVGIDGSAASDVAVGWAARDAARRDAQLTLVHVLPSPMLSRWPEPPLPDASWAWHEEHGRRLLDGAESIAVRAIEGLGPITLARRALPGHAVPVLADLSKDATMVVVGRSGRNALQRRLVGSVTSGLLHHAHAPVAVIPSDDPPTPGAGPVLLGVDGPPTADAATTIAFDEASRLGVGVIALHSWEDTDLRQFSTADRERCIESGNRALAARVAAWQERYPDVPVERRLVHGEPARNLVAASESAQFTVVGSHGRGGFVGMLLGSVSSVVVQAIQTPIIVARVR